MRTAAAVCFLAALLAAPLCSQRTNSDQDTNTRTVHGTVMDASGAPVAQAVVQLKNTKTLQIRSFITAQDGHYHFAGLSMDVEYQLKAEHNGSSSSWKTLSVFNSKQTVVLNLKLNR